jgi:hypothetical protein
VVFDRVHQVCWWPTSTPNLECLTFKQIDRMDNYGSLYSGQTKRLNIYHCHNLEEVTYRKGIEDIHIHECCHLNKTHKNGHYNTLN